MEKLSGMLQVDTYIDTDQLPIQAWAHHYLNLLEKNDQISDSTFSSSDMTTWYINSWNLRNGVADHMPEAYPPIEFRRDNAGTLFAVHFPLRDFEPVLSALHQKKAKDRRILLLERFKSFKGLLNKFRTSEEISIVVAPGGIFFPEEVDPLEQAKEAYEESKTQANDLARRLLVAQTMRVDTMLILKGYNLAESLESHGSKVEALVLGPSDQTRILLARLSRDPDDTFMELFNPENSAVRYEFGSLNNKYKAPPFSTGKYHPLRNFKELRVQDYTMQA